MAISGDLGVFSCFASYPNHPRFLSAPPPKLNFSGLNGVSGGLEISPKWPQTEPLYHHQWSKHNRCCRMAGNRLHSVNISKETEGLLLNAVNMSFFERLSLAWRILFPTVTARKNSNANVAKQRLKMILFSDRCAVSDEAKQKIVSNIVGVLSDFVEIDSHDKVQLSVSADTDLGTVYSVTVPIRRVKPEYLDNEEEYRGITNIEYKDTGEKSGVVDVKFDFYQPE